VDDHENANLCVCPARIATMLRHERGESPPYSRLLAMLPKKLRYLCEFRLMSELQLDPVQPGDEEDGMTHKLLHWLCQMGGRAVALRPCMTGWLEFEQLRWQCRALLRRIQRGQVTPPPTQAGAFGDTGMMCDWVAEKLSDIAKLQCEEQTTYCNARVESLNRASQMMLDHILPHQVSLSADSVSRVQRYMIMHCFSFDGDLDKNYLKVANEVIVDFNWLFSVRQNWTICGDIYDEMKQRTRSLAARVWPGRSLDDIKFTEWCLVSAKVKPQVDQEVRERGFVRPRDRARLLQKEQERQHRELMLELGDGVNRRMRSKTKDGE